VGRRVRAARREGLERLDPRVKQRVLSAIGRLAEDPQSADLRRLKGRAESRLRVGDWRVIIELDVAARAIIIERILVRGRAYHR
jgi:mRNA-degrading endonuclease RelE of RelBE toxin-antitoxin system